jgi:hypothetical protein
MSLIKKIDVEKHFAERRAVWLGRMLPLGRLGAIGTKSAAKRKSVPASTQAVNLEPSSPRVSSAPMPIASGSAHNRLLRPAGSRQR